MHLGQGDNQSIFELFRLVLLIEDTTAHARLIMRGLRDLVGEIEHVISPAEACEKLSLKNYDLIICDLRLPEVQGCEHIEKIVSNYPHTPLIVLTSSTEIDQAVSAMRAGAWDFTVKSFGEDFTAQISMVLQRTAMRVYQHQREMKVQAERDAFSYATASAQDGLAIIDQEARIRFANGAFLKFLSLLGYRAAEFTELNDCKINELISSINPSVAQELILKIENRNTKILWKSELELSKTSGDEYRCFELSLSVEEENRILWIRDISISKEQERFQRDLLSTTTHDLKGPLSAILASTELIEDNQSVTDEKIKDLILRIASCAKNSINLIDELLSARKIQEGLLIIKEQKIDLNEFFDELITEYSAIARAKNITLKKEIKSKCYVCADKIGLFRVFGNLISNALKFTDKGGVVVLSGEVVNDSVRINVSDNGHGIESKMQHRLFEKFSRLEKHRDIDGSGLGLFVVKNIVDAHRGKIEVSSELGKGTTFTVTLALAK